MTMKSSRKFGGNTRSVLLALSSCIEFPMTFSFCLLLNGIFGVKDALKY